MTRKHNAEIAENTIAILEKGYYEINGQRVEIGNALNKSIKETSSYPPEKDVPKISNYNEYTTNIIVVNETTLVAAEKTVNEGYKTAILNFASANNPGGGFRSGAQAQEESLARSSGLYKCIVNNKMYSYHRSRKNPIYSNYAIYSPDVPIFKNDEGHLLHPYQCSFITCPAVNAGAMRKQWREQVEGAMRERIKKILSLAAFYGNEACILGAWGCGVFRNDPEMIAQLFDQIIREDFRHVFQKIVFAILDSKKQMRIAPFYRVFQSKDYVPVSTNWVQKALEGIQKKQTIKVRPIGGSMRGRIESGQLVTLKPISSKEAVVGDIIFLKWKKGNYLLHIIKEIKNDKYLIGNNLGKTNGWINKEAILAKVIKIED